MTQLEAASYRFSLPSPSFAFDGVRTPPEELVNSASPELALRLVRSQINQPDLTFPQSPGIILKRTTSILLSAARFVLSMNCEHHSIISRTDYDLICTTYPLKRRGEQRVNNSDSRVKSRVMSISTVELFTAKRRTKTGGEQVGVCSIRSDAVARTLLISFVGKSPAGCQRSGNKCGPAARRIRKAHAVTPQFSS